MPEDFPEGEDRETDAPVAHDDIMQRLLRYQRQLRGDEEEPDGTTAESPAPPEVPVATSQAVTEPSVAVPDRRAPETSSEAPALEPTWTEGPSVPTTGAPPAPPKVSEASSPWPVVAGPDGGDLARRVEQLEQTLAHVARMITELRERFQDMAIAADERLGDIERALSVVQPDPEPEAGPPTP